MTDKPNWSELSMVLHERLRGKIRMVSKMPVQSKDDLSTSYTPGVAEPCKVIAANPEKAHALTIKSNAIAIVSDGSAVLGLGNIGGLASLPVMEGKALLMREFAGLDAWPICLATQDVDEIVATVRAIEPTFGGINLEDIAAPACFEVEERLQDLGIPVFHDDQHGTAIVLAGALINAGKLTNKKIGDMRIIINGAGAAGTAIAQLLCSPEFCDATQGKIPDIILCDSRGAIAASRDNLNDAKKKLLSYTNKSGASGLLADVIAGSDAFIGVSQPGVLTQDMVRQMNADPIIFAMSNPIPEIMPDEALAAGAAVVGTGRSDFPNQVNNLLAFPGIFRGALDSRATAITSLMKAKAAVALANATGTPTRDRVLPDPLDRSVVPAVANAVAECVES